MNDTAQLCKCCAEPITELVPFQRRDGSLIRHGHCTNPACPMCECTLTLTALAALTSDQMVGYAKSRIAHLLRQLQAAAQAK